ncbi:MAG: DUF4468 domain-containing protein [Paraprevotella sp.]|nr:DUF4468 domain-containing protein [Paraprevotella sp.]
MRKILLLLLCVPMLVFAKEKRDDSKYLVGAVPEVNGQVLFQQTFAVKNKSKDEIYQVMKAYLGQMMKEENQMKGTKMAMEDSVAGTLVGRFEEWMIFKKKPFVLDRTRFRYLLTVQCSEGKCHMELTQISYYYEEDLDGSNGRTYRAEEWINDANALNKAQTKLLWGSAKFRRKTVDRVEEIFTGARDAFEKPIIEQQRKATELID